MAKQHFYSRVPSRVAMFFKADGFDTFACSSDINRSFIEKDMVPILEQKPTPEELTLIRNEQLPPLYCAYQIKDGDYVQSCVSYIPLDYTGERSSYLVHSLLYNDEEVGQVLNNPSQKVLNDEMFVHNLDDFDITSPLAKPIKDYDQKTFESVPLSKSLISLTEDYDVLTLKKLIFACIGAICNKYKAVYVLLPKTCVDLDVVDFYNALIQIFPYHLRKYLSFVSRVSDFNKYPTFKLRVMSGDFGAAPTSKGVTIDFQNKVAYGIKENDIKDYGHLADFLYRLLSKEEERLEFLNYCDYVTSGSDLIANASFKEINDLVFLFKVCCPFYDEKIVLPNDEKMLEFYTCYEKYRSALSDEYRIKGLTSLRRYPESYTAIPKNVFNKVSKIYPTEISGTKLIIMNVCLELIHTDLMRPMLFNFIKNNYDQETDIMKESIIDNLSKVFYGGFLQLQIIQFFDEHFDTETEINRSVILEKLLLAIRTKEIQAALFDFVNKHYSVFTLDEKKAFYTASAEHLPEGDELAKKLLALCDVHIEEEPEDLQKLYSKNLYKVLEAEQKRKEQLLLPLVATSDGFTFKAITEAIFTKWKTRRITTEFISLACTGTLDERVDRIIDMWNIVQNDLDIKMVTKFLKSVEIGFSEHPATFELEDVFNAENKLRNALLTLEKDGTEEFLNGFVEKIIYPLISSSITGVFKNNTPGSVEKVVEYANSNSKVKESPKYEVLEEYLRLANAIKEYNVINSLQPLNNLYLESDLRRKISTYLLNDLYTSKVLIPEGETYNKREALCLICVNFLQSGNLGFGSAYDKIFNRFNETVEAGKTHDFNVQTFVVPMYFDILTYASMMEKNASEEFKPQIRKDEAGLITISNDLVTRYSQGQLKLVLNKITDNPSLINYIKEQTKKTKSNAKLFAKVVKL